MAAYASGTNTPKRQKTTFREVSTNRITGSETPDFFQGFGRAEYRPEANVEDSVNYKHYNGTAKVHGRSMEEWLRPAISFSHVVNEFHAHGRNLSKLFNETGNQLTQDYYKMKIRVVFELGSKLGVKFFTATDRDLAPDGDSLEDFQRSLDENVELILELQQKTGITPLWIKPHFPSLHRYNDISDVIYKGATIKKALDLAQKLNAENFLLDEVETVELFSNTDFTKKYRQYARLLKLTTEYREHLGYRGQLLLRPRYDEERGKNADAIAANAIAFLKNFNLDRFYKLSVRPGYDFQTSFAYNLLGSLEVTNFSSPLDLRYALLLTKTLIEHGGIQPGGLNIELKSNFESDLKDVFIGHVNTLDTYAKALKIASKLISDGILTNSVQQRYIGFHSGFGSRFMNGEISLDDLEEQAKRISGENKTSQGPNYWATFYSRYIFE